MPDARLAIGGLPLVLDGGPSVARAMELPGFAVFAIRHEAAHPVRFLLDRQVGPTCLNERHRFEILDGNAICRFGTDAEGRYLYLFGDSEGVRFDPRRPDEAEISPMDDPNKLRFALWLSYCMTGIAHGRLPIHSSAVVCDGRAVLCLGESGTGKSTHTRLWLENIPETHLLNDDSPILAIMPDGHTEVYGSPWSGKTPCFRQEHHPVAALLRLEQRPQNSIRRLSALEAFAALQPSCPPAMAHDERCTDLVVRFISEVIGHTPTYRLGCLPDADASHLSHREIFGTAKKQL